MKLLYISLIVILNFTCCFFIDGNEDANFNGRQDELNLFFNDFVEIKQKHVDFRKVKFIIYGDSLSFKNWIYGSGVDIKRLEADFGSDIHKAENLIAIKQPHVFTKYKNFSFEAFEIYKKRYPTTRFVDYYALHYKPYELISVNFLVFNTDKSKALIYHSLGYGGGYIELYSKKKQKWFLYKTIAETT